ncbi:periplasmic binding protein [Endogone sp. FLAS-F59071]|nr:periplasmic binding protein [Endogone sp. FLAS-F59071]|eukprot:RUS18076.1 periplasmic binding protein [Endogone sp. FLAS-F59071]
MPVNFYGLSVYRQFYIQMIYVFIFMIPFLVVPTLAQQNSQQCITNYNAQTDYFPAKVQVDTATLFSVNYFHNYKLVSNKRTNETFALYQCGTPVPANLPNGTKIFSVPVRRVATLATTSNTFLEELGVGSDIVALDVEQFVSSPCLQKGLNNGTIAQVSSTNTTAMTQTLAQVDVVFGSDTATSSNNTVSDSEVEDPGTLNRAEWVEFYSTWFNLEDVANNISAKINNNYNCLRRAANNITGTKPLVAWVSYDAPASYNNNTPSWSISTATYKQQFTTDAGATFLAPSNAYFLSSKDFLTAIQNVDVIIDETYIAASLSDVLGNFGISNTTASSYKFVANKAIYREDGVQTVAGGDDWFESAVAFDDAVLADVIAAAHPGYPSAAYTRIWLRNIAEGEPIKYYTAANCTGSEATPRADPAFVCTGNFAVASQPSSTPSGSGSGALAISVLNALIVAVVAIVTTTFIA